MRQTRIYSDKPLLQLPCTISLIHCEKFKKIFKSKSRVMRMGHFWVQIGPFAPSKRFFFGKINNIIFIYLMTYLKNCYNRPRILRRHHFWTQNGPFAQTKIFSENLLMNLVPIMHAYLHSKSQSQILIY